MKNVFLFSVVAATFAASALAANPIKTCSTDLAFPDRKTVPTKFEIFADQGSFKARVTQTTEGQTGVYEDTVEISQNTIRGGLTAKSSSENIGEALVVHALSLTEDPIFEGFFKVGFDLKAARTATVYEIGKSNGKDNIGLSAIVEARDQNGKALGSFFGGYLVSDCQ